MSKKISKEDFMTRFNNSFPEADIEILNYSAISNPITVRCKKCNKIITNTKASNLLKNFSCCINNETKIERITKIYNKSESYHLIKQLNPYDVLVHCDKCGNDIKRNISSCLQSPYACKYCEIRKVTQMTSKEEIQKRLDEEFHHNLQILSYDDQLGTYKCLKCGLIFKANQIRLMASRGCPKCNRFKSKGETFIKNYLEEKNIKFKEQVSVKELPLQHFDFGFYDDNNLLLGFIEVQGEQHFENIAKNSLEKIQEKDNRKRNFCKERNVPLYELIYKKGKIKNLDILPF